eukprot:1179604-Prorocentrum_minimum.AAC.1
MPSIASSTVSTASSTASSYASSTASVIHRGSRPPRPPPRQSSTASVVHRVSRPLRQSSTASVLHRSIRTRSFSSLGSHILALSAHSPDRLKTRLTHPAAAYVREVLRPPPGGGAGVHGHRPRRDDHFPAGHRLLQLEVRAADGGAGGLAALRVLPPAPQGERGRRLVANQEASLALALARLDQGGHVAARDWPRDVHVTRWWEYASAS